VKAWKTRWRVRDPEKLPAWLATIARHKAHDVFRKRRTVPFSEQQIEPVELEPANTTVLDQQFAVCARRIARSSIGRRLHCATSKKWIIALSKNTLGLN